MLKSGVRALELGAGLLAFQSLKVFVYGQAAADVYDKAKEWARE